MGLFRKKYDPKKYSIELFKEALEVVRKMNGFIEKNKGVEHFTTEQRTNVLMETVYILLFITQKF